MRSHALENLESGSFQLFPRLTKKYRVKYMYSDIIDLRKRENFNILLLINHA